MNIIKLLSRHLLFAVILLLFLNCTTKVSEWTLQNYSPSNYELVYYHSNESMDSELTEANKQLNRKLSHANIVFRSVNKNKITNVQEQYLYSLAPNTKQPFYALFYEERLFATFNSPEELTGLTESVLRRQIADEILKGNLCVILLLKTGNKEKDAIASTVIENFMKDCPLKSIMPVFELSRNNAAEKMFVKMLLNVEYDLADIDGPMIFPIFGRFRILEPLLGQGITEENLDVLVRFLTADCSCLIKGMLPGMDMLCTNNWENPAPALLSLFLNE